MSGIGGIEMIFDNKFRASEFLVDKLLTGKVGKYIKNKHLIISSIRVKFGEHSYTIDYVAEDGNTVASLTCCGRAEPGDSFTLDFVDVKLPVKIT